MKQYNEMRLEDILQPGKRVAFYARYSTKDQGYEMQKHSVEVLLERYGCEIKKSMWMQEFLLQRFHLKRDLIYKINL